MDLLQILIDYQNTGIGVGIGAAIIGIVLKINGSLRSKFKEKANVTSVNNRFKEMHEKINLKADSSEFRQFDKKLDLLINLIKKNGN